MCFGANAEEKEGNLSTNKMALVKSFPHHFPVFGSSAVSSLRERRESKTTNVV